MKVGLDAFTIREMNFSAMEMIDYAIKYKFDGIQFDQIRSLCPTLSFQELQTIKNYALDNGMYINISISGCNPILADKSPIELAEIISDEIKIVSKLGWKEVRSFLGVLRNRNTHPVCWQEHLEASKKVIQLLKPLLNDEGVRINLETHSDSTSYELIGIIDAVGSDIVGITLDTGNLLLHGEHPILAAQRLAPYIHLTHAKDCLLFFSEEGYIRQGCAPGQGIVAWKELVSILAEQNPGLELSLEDHKGLYAVPIYLEEWHKEHPHLSAFELAQIIKLVHTTEKRLQSGEVEEMESYEKVPFLIQMEDRLSFGRDYLKNLLVEMQLYS